MITLPFLFVATLVVAGAAALVYIVTAFIIYAINNRI